jgi:Uma2 family endonuclease
MAMTTATQKPAMLPYVKRGEIDYTSLEYNPDAPEPMPEAMEQELVVQEIIGILSSRFTDFWSRPDVFLSSNTILCYDPTNLNVRRQPDIYLSFGVDQAAVRRRKIYLPWEAGKPPDLALEVGSESTGSEDTVVKPQVYATIGISEYWRFDPSGGEHHGAPMSGGMLRDDGYHPIELATEPDGVLKGYSEVMGLFLCWDDGWPRFYDPVTESYLENWRQERAAHEAERAAHEAERAAHEAQRTVLSAENERLRELVRRLQSEG